MSSKLREAARDVIHHYCLNCPYNWTGKRDLPKSEGESKHLCYKIKKLRAVLAEPVRNCDRQYENGYDVLRRFTAETGRQIFDTVDVINWLLAEAKGEGTK